MCISLLSQSAYSSFINSFYVSTKHSLVSDYVLVFLTASRLNSKDILHEVYANNLAHKAKYLVNLGSPKQRRDF